jgi:hypothetical protein
VIKRAFYFGCYRSNGPKGHYLRGAFGEVQLEKIPGFPMDHWEPRHRLARQRQAPRRHQRQCLLDGREELGRWRLLVRVLLVGPHRRLPPQLKFRLLCFGVRLAREGSCIRICMRGFPRDRDASAVPLEVDRQGFGVMTPTQRELARHALGLAGGRTVTYRNHFVTGPAATIIHIGWRWSRPVWRRAAMEAS